MIIIKRTKASHGFTLIELMVVIAIIAIIVTLAMPNFLSARQRARDVKKKAEMAEFKNALRMYYNDYQQYPDPAGGGAVHSNIAGCGAAGDGDCPCYNGGSFVGDFAAGTNCSTMYMKKFPDDFGGTGTTNYYVAGAANDDFCLVTSLDNLGDGNIQTSHDRCASVCQTLLPPRCTDTDTDEFCMCAD